MDQIIRIGTRGSLLALWQANHVANILQQKGAKTEIIVINTKGDLILDKSLSKIGSKGIFTAELESALFENRIDIAQHSAKDVQSILPEGLELIAFTEREKVNDVMVSNHPHCDLNKKDIVVGTSSTRRAALLKHFYPQVKTVEMRGNLQTRIKKLENGHCDALLLAYAGIYRMGYANLITQTLDSNEFTPPVGQGTVAIQCASSLDINKKNFIKNALNHSQTEQVLIAERQFLQTLEGGCSIPSFALAEVKNNMIKMRGGVVSLDGQKLVKFEMEGSLENPAKLGKDLAELVLTKGGKEILDSIRINSL